MKTISRKKYVLHFNKLWQKPRKKDHNKYLRLYGKPFFVKSNNNVDGYSQEYSEDMSSET